MPGRAGLAAPQIGVGLRAFSYNVDGEVGYVLNPVLEVEGEPELVDEGCLSVPGFVFPRRRYPLRPRHRHRPRRQPGRALEGDGLMAQALQHESDHLDGMLYLEGLDPEIKRDGDARGPPGRLVPLVAQLARPAAQPSRSRVAVRAQ